MAAQAGRFDFILDTVSAPHDLQRLSRRAQADGTLVLVGLPSEPPTVAGKLAVIGAASLAGSVIGGIAETQEMLDYCAEHEIVCDVEVIAVQKINEAYDRLVNGDVKYRFVHRPRLAEVVVALDLRLPVVPFFRLRCRPDAVAASVRQEA